VQLELLRRLLEHGEDPARGADCGHRRHGRLREEVGWGSARVWFVSVRRVSWLRDDDVA
jgi:hypothetical protein